MRIGLRIPLRRNDDSRVTRTGGKVARVYEVVLFIRRLQAARKRQVAAIRNEAGLLGGGDGGRWLVSWNSPASEPLFDIVADHLAEIFGERRAAQRRGFLAVDEDGRGRLLAGAGQ